MNKAFVGLSACELRSLATAAVKIAAALEERQPSIELALESGIEDKSYDTRGCGRVLEYSGEVIITMENGDRWLAVGHGSQGGPSWISKQGWIEFTPIH